MKFGHFKGTDRLNRTFNRIRELGLESNITELNTYGFTVVPPEKVADREFFHRLREDRIASLQRKNRHRFCS